MNSDIVVVGNMQKAYKGSKPLNMVGCNQIFHIPMLLPGQLQWASEPV